MNGISPHKRIGLIGGLSWESTSSYYRLLNEFTARDLGAWHQPHVIVDSLDFSEIVQLQQRDDWTSTGAVLADSARRLESAGAEVLAICANTMHRNFDQVQASVSIPVIDIREAMIHDVRELAVTSISLLGTKYLMDDNFYSAYLEAAGVRVIKPDDGDSNELQAMIFDELTQGVVTERTRNRFLQIADRCQSRGGGVVGLCCTEFGLLVDATNAPWPFIDSTVAHVNALLRFSSGLSGSR